MTHGRRSKAIGLLLVGSVVLLTAACTSSKKSSGGDSSNANAPVTITVGGEPDTTDPVNRANYLADITAFEKLHPNITVTPDTSTADPVARQAKISGGTLENVYPVYFTDPAQLIAHHQGADISSDMSTIPAFKDLDPNLMKIFQDSNGKTFGIPITNYTLGLVYNRALFTQAGLDPNSPPTTWADVASDAKKIAALGKGIVGYGDYSAANTGGWHFTAEIYSLGGSMATQSNGKWTASFNSDEGKQVLQQLHDMRWTDNSMGTKQLLQYADLLTDMGSGKLGMYIGAYDNIPSIVNQFKTDFTNFGLGAMPGGKGALAGGNGFMFNATDSQAQIKAGLVWLNYEYDDPSRQALADQRAVAAKNAVGLPQPNLWTGASAATVAAANTQYANVPAQNFAPFVAGQGSIPIVLEPPNAQQIYAVLDTVMAKVLTDKNANIPQLLSTAETQVNSILATVAS
jgi:multiple sugar transport system substrate-binding protein